MKSRPLAYLFVLSLALNAGVLGTMAYRHFTAPPLTPPTCPFISSDQRLYESLGLSSEQMDAMRPLANSFHANLRELQVSATEQRDALLTLLEAEKLDIPAIKAANVELSARQARVQSAVMAHLLEMKRILNPAQQKEFFRLMRQTLSRDVEGPAVLGPERSR
jgi:Spy/CpxP family protein refolding chaperone